MYEIYVLIDLDRVFVHICVYMCMCKDVDLQDALLDENSLRIGEERAAEAS